MEVVYAIPSRARADTLVAKTLPLLARLGIPGERIHVFVAEPEREEYLATIRAADLPSEILDAISVETGAVGMCAQRNAIQDFYPDDALVVTVDDDMRDLVVRAGEKRLLPIEPDEWTDLVGIGFAMLDTLGARLWGLYPVPNPYFMRPRTRTDLCYVGGGLYGFVNRKDGVLDSTLEYRDDWERSVRCYAADGAIVRFDYVTWRTQGYAGKGGMQTGGDRTYEATLADCEALVRRYPDLVSLNLTKKSGWPETRLRDRRPQAEALA